MLSFARRRPISGGGKPGNLLGIHLFQCPDAVGIVAKLSECIASRGGNIHSVDVFVPDDKPVFYSRRHGIPYHHLPTTPGNKREQEILDLIQGTDFVVLARYMQAFNAGVKLIGATSHFVTPELDAGPIIEQMVERVSHRDTLQSFVVKSENLEKQCLAEAIKSYCELRVLPYELKKTVVF
ncbi:hypothetical protein PR202_gb18272 [Eleusine coracana subsp. coracana]|uniref:Formyl transferase N-terminal domain-containing protein n=1 Tax=Eleusine coracana subsp. coracana TaxID=191504 RepID=A0AAV5F6P4_ELECO|nr:hypothetical protein PR202_gb18272 [Eleusine coracana subsp. coracana]